MSRIRPRSPVRFPVAPDSEHQFQRELNLPHRHLRRLVDQAEARLVARKRIEWNQVVSRALKICPVQDVEELGAKLDVKIFAEPGDVVVLDEGHIEIEQTWSDDRVARQVAQ